MDYLIQVLTLEGSLARQENISQQFNKYNLSFDFFFGVDGRIDDHYLFKKYNSKLRLSQGRPGLNRGELGCFASHYLLWEKCISLNKPMLIIEDDAILFQEEFLEFINNLPLKNTKLECLRLFSSKRQMVKTNEDNRIDISKHLSVYWHEKGFSSTTGYYLTPNGAKKLLEFADVWQMEVDIYMDCFWVHDVLPYGVYPACLNNDESFESNIYTNKKGEKRSRMNRFKSEIFNLKNNIERLSYRYR